jgi:chemotaxis signal transduction protein
VVRSGASKYALPTADVVRVVRGLNVHPIPGSGLHLLGLAQYGGEPLPVLDLQALFGDTTSSGRYPSTVILGRRRERTHSLVGLAVDEILQVANVAEAAVLSGHKGLVVGEAEIDGARTNIVNTKRLLGEVTDESGA